MLNFYEDDVVIAPSGETVDQRDAREARTRAKEWLSDGAFQKFLKGFGQRPEVLSAGTVNFLADAWYGATSVAELRAAEAVRIAEAERQAAEQRAADAAKVAAAIAERDRWAAFAADPVARDGNDAVSLRAVMAWRRLNPAPAVQFKVTNPDARAALLAADAELTELQRTHEAAIAAATAERERVRRARTSDTDPLPEIPAPFDLRAYVDPDALARWFVGHQGGYTLVAGRGGWYARPNPDGTTGPQEWRVTEPPKWRAIYQRITAWVTARQHEATAALYPAEADAWRAKALDALLSTARLPVTGWSFAPPEPAEGPPGDFVDDEPEDEDALELDDVEPSASLERAIDRFRRYVAKHPGCGNKELRTEVKAGRRFLDQALPLMLDGGVIEDRGTGGAHAYHIVSR